MSTSTHTRSDRADSVTLACILTVVAISAGWASFTHVHDWTMRRAPTGTPDAFGWVNAVISELVPVAAFLTIRRRRRAGASIGYPLALLIAAASLSLAAQLAVAQPSPSGWLLSAVPALAFMALVKLVFATPASVAPTVSAPSTSDAAVSLWLNAGVPATQVAEWAGHSVHVLLKVYAKCIDGQDEAARRRIEAALNMNSDEEDA